MDNQGIELKCDRHDITILTRALILFIEIGNHNSIVTEQATRLLDRIMKLHKAANIGKISDW